MVISCLSFVTHDIQCDSCLLPSQLHNIAAQEWGGGEACLVAQMLGVKPATSEWLFDFDLLYICCCIFVSLGYYALLTTASHSDPSCLHRHLLDIKSQVSIMSLAPPTAGAVAASSRADDRLLVAVRESTGNDSSTL